MYCQGNIVVAVFVNSKIVSKSKINDNTDYGWNNILLPQPLNVVIYPFSNIAHYLSLPIGCQKCTLQSADG